MVNIYYIPISGSVTVATETNTILTQYTNVTLEITASAYETSGSTFNSTLGDLRVYIKSGSTVLTTFPIDGTTIYYNQSLTYNQPPLPPQDTTYILNYVFYPSNTTSSATDKFKISGSDINSTLSQSFNSGVVFPNYTTASGSGLFYTSSILITDENIRATLQYITGSNTYISTSFSSSGAGTYKVVAQTEAAPYIALSYSASAFPTTSLAGYNALYNITASATSSSGNTVYLIGGNLNTITELRLSSSFRISNFDSFGLNNLNYLDLGYEYLRSYPSLSALPNLYTLYLPGNYLTSSIFNYTSSNITNFVASNNNMSGSVQNILNSLSTSSISTLDISNNNLTGSIPILSQSFQLQTFSCQYNKLSGNIPSLLGNGNLQFFNCSNNLLTSIPNLSNASSLTYFDCHDNLISGSLPFIPNWLGAFNCSNNRITGSINLPSASGLSSFICEYNLLSGSIGSLNACTNLTLFDCSNNYLRNNIPSLSNNTALQYFYCNDNYLSGSIPNLSNNTNLIYFDCHNNYLTGSIPSLSNNTALQYFYGNNNQFTNYISASGTGTTISPSLTYFNASSNLLSQSAIDGILKDLDNTGAINGYLNISGSGNSAPSVAGYINALSLINKGWTANTVPMPSQSISIATGSSVGWANSYSAESLNLAQTFQMFENGVMQNVVIKLGKLSNPIFNIQLNLYDCDDIGYPFNLLTTSSNAISASVLPTLGSFSNYTFNFNNYILTGSVSTPQKYAVGITYSNIVTHDNSNHIGWSFDYLSPSGVYPYGSKVSAPSLTPNDWTFNYETDLFTLITYLTS